MAKLPKVPWDEAGEFKTVPPGTYSAYCFEAELTTSSKNQPMIKFIFKISGGEFKGQQIFRNCSLQTNALGFTKPVITAILGRSLSSADELDTDEMVGKPVQIKVSNEEYEDKTVARVDEVYKAVEGQQTVEISEEEVPF